MKHAVYCATRNLYDAMETAAKSLVANTPVDKVHFLMEDAEFPRPLPDIIECHDVSGQDIFDPEGPNANCRWTWMVLMRAALCHVLPDVDRVLSIDCDTVCAGDASGAWELPLDGCYLAGVKEGGKSKHGLQYVNMGVALFDLEKLRDGKADEIVDVLNRHYFRWPEQDVFNFLCQGRIAEMDSAYNYCPWVVNPILPVRIVHYAAREDWRDEPPARKYRAMTWDEAMERHGEHL